MPKKVILIADPGIDTAFAVALALHDPNLDVIGLLPCAGNVPAEQATANVNVLIDHLDPAKHVPPEEKFDWQPKELVAVLGSHRQRLPGNASTLAVGPDGAVVLASGHAIDVATRKTLDWPTLVAFSPDGKRGAYANKVWEIADLKKAPVE